jgi:hypothetical protein
MCVFYVCYSCAVFLRYFCCFLIFNPPLRWTRAECDHTKKRQKKQQSKILQANEYKIYCIPEDGHVGRNM